MRSAGGEGLDRARGRSREKKLRKLAKSNEAYTVKVKDKFGEATPEAVCRLINERAGRGHPEKDYDRQGRVVGKLIRAFVTDAQEVWARVIPVEPHEEKRLSDIW